MKRLVWLALVGCGGNEVPADALASCRVELSGNLVESTAPASCATVVPGVGATQGDTLLHVVVPSPALGPLTIDLDLGREPAPGGYASGTTALWSATATKTVAPGGACVFLAGNNATPSGYFTLDVATINPPHGELELTLFVLPRTADDGTPTDCGPGTTEAARIRF